MRNLFVRALVVALVLLGAYQLKAQDSASLAGTVTDATGAVVPDVTVTLTNTTTGATFTQTTDRTGSYHFLNVLPSSGYKESFAHAGFSVYQISDITLNVGTTRTQDARLAASGGKEQVVVSAGSEEVTLNTTDASIGNNIAVEQLNDLPVYDRGAGISTLFYLQAGVDESQGAVTGARIDQSETTVDGLDVNDNSTGQTFLIVANAPVDSVQQFTGTVAGLQPTIGTGSGGQFQLVTKNGTNQFHGNVNEYHRDTATEANTYFNNQVGLPRTPLIRNQFGGNVGGPILKDKLFFFFNYGGSRIIQSFSTERTVPLDSFRNGTLNYINNGNGCNDGSRLNTTPSCITNLSGAQVAALDPASTGFDQSLLSFINGRYPHANDLTQGDGVNTGGYRFNEPGPDTNNSYVGRIDYNLTHTQKIFGRFTINRDNGLQNFSEFDTDPLTHPAIDRDYAYVVSHTWTIGSNKVNQFYYGDTIEKFATPDLYNPTGANQYSFTGIDGPYTAYDGQQRRVPNPEVRDDFNFQHGKHSLTFGGTYRFVTTHSNLVNDFNFVQAGETGSGLATGLATDDRPTDIFSGGQHGALNDYDQLFTTALGVVGEVQTNFDYNNQGQASPAGTGGPRAYRFFQTEAYFGDTWKVTNKLTVSYGVRYQYYTVPYEAHGDESVATPIPLDTYINDRLTQSATGNTSNTGLPFYSFALGGKINNGPNFYQPDQRDFGPRFAVSYAPFDSRKTVFNASGNIDYDRTVINAINFLQDQISFLFANTGINNIDFGGPDATLANAPRLGGNLAINPSAIPGSLPVQSPVTPFVGALFPDQQADQPYGLAQGQFGFVIDPRLRDPYSIAFNVGVQQELPFHLVAKVNYVGRLGRRLIADADSAQVIDVPDYTGKSTQSLSQAFAALTTQVRAGVPVGSLTPQPWFEDILGTSLANFFGLPNNTNAVAALAPQSVQFGNISGVLLDLANVTVLDDFTGLLPSNIGIPSQFASNAYLTNKGSSNYNGLLVTVNKNVSSGLQFQFNYTYSHSIDNTSESANNNALFNGVEFICDILRPRTCRGNSDFDVRQEINSNFDYALPFGRGKLVAANAPQWLDEAIGGWSVDGIPAYRTGTALTAYSAAALASAANSDPAIFTGNKRDLKTKVNVDPSSNSVFEFAGGGAGGQKVLGEFRGPLGIEYGQRDGISGPGAFFFDAGVRKTFPIIENKINLKFGADGFNVFNHPVFNGGGLNIVGNASQYGQITSTANALSGLQTRVLQFFLRLEF
jgi:hypothetical protein